MMYGCSRTSNGTHESQILLVFVVELIELSGAASEMNLSLQQMLLSKSRHYTSS